MRLKKIKLAGFKSFVDPTTIPFPSEMTAVVGPNGCGKSNVIDAVRWVLGESSAKNLRGDAMTDVIFNGSTSRKPVSQCSVELVFDNSSGRIQGEYAGYNELSVKRIVSKDAQSSYLLNNSKCRRRDVTDLFLGTGLGPRSYAIIEQGMISRLIESKPQELRVFIEEAAGVSKYKERRRETETRIRHTKENLERLEDVRGELGQQLEKLQRQATAARRYKELKHNERQLKAELAAIRWLQHNDKIIALEATITQKNLDIEEYVTQQKGDENNIALFKQQQQDLKQQQSTLQQQGFKVGTDITRIEQSQLHTKQRRQQIEQEQQDLLSRINDNSLHHQQNIEKTASLTEQVESVEPEKELLEEQVEQAQYALLEAEEGFHYQQNQWRTQEQNFNQSKAQAQSSHSKIQSMMAMQLRTQQRISEVKDELAELLDDELSGQIDEQQQQSIVLQSQHQHDTSDLKQLTEQHFAAIHALKQAEQQYLDIKGQQQSIQAQCDALNTLQKSTQDSQLASDFLQQHDIDAQKWWQTLDVVEGWESAFETITQQWLDCYLLPNQAQLNTLSELPNSGWMFAQGYTDVIPDNCIAHKLTNKHVPKWLTSIKTASSLAEAQSILGQLAAHESVVTQDGLWLSEHWLVTGKTDANAGLLKRAKQIKGLQLHNEQVLEKLAEAELMVQQCQQKQQESSQQQVDKKTQVEQLTNQIQQVSNQLQLLNQQQQQNLGRNERLSQELHKQQSTLVEEQLELEELSLQAEELEIQAEQLKEVLLDCETIKEQLQNKVTNSRNQLEANKNKLHQLALHFQSVKSQLDGLLANQVRDQQLLDDLTQKKQQLSTEYAELALPLDEQKDHLQILLEQKAEIELEQISLQETITTVEEKLQIAEKGQQGVTEKIQLMLSALQSIKLECEGARVRAGGVLEQLLEMQVILQEVLDSLPDDAQEKTWMANLDKTTSALTRLGAVNLAAVEEYETQATRKKHLDDQNQDLESALDILEQAIRKIDKETRSRFKETFEQVNSDLQVLFPKVFGGGHAYLDLTDSDLLETGVTIMARPPGKKNSTIHLLSGGEKALTALSLVFAIFRLNPAPFCLLDEVDAPLDDANVGRFCKLVSEMSKSVQFIYITHNKIAMEMATHLTGVTMAEPGVSRMVAVDVDEAVAIAQA